jgi:hypothetical protein
MAARIPMIAITISNSMRVKPDVFLCVEYFCITILVFDLSIIVHLSFSFFSKSSFESGFRVGGGINSVTGNDG